MGILHLNDVPCLPKELKVRIVVPAASTAFTTVCPALVSCTTREYSSCMRKVSYDLVLLLEVVGSAPTIQTNSFCFGKN